MLRLPEDLEEQLKDEFIQKHVDMRKTIPIPKNEKYSLPDFIHRLTYGVGIEERVNEEARKKAEEVKAKLAISVKHFSKLGIKPKEIAQILELSIDEVLEFIRN